MSNSKLAQAIKADTAGIGKIDQRVTAVSQSLERLHIEDDGMYSFNTSSSK